MYVDISHYTKVQSDISIHQSVKENSSQGQKHTLKSNKLTIIILNCQSIVPKKANLKCLIDITNPDILIASETWLTPSISSNEFFPSNYITYCKDRVWLWGRIDSPDNP